MLTTHHFQLVPAGRCGAALTSSSPHPDGKDWIRFDSPFVPVGRCCRAAPISSSPPRLPGHPQLQRSDIFVASASPKYARAPSGAAHSAHQFHRSKIGFGRIWLDSADFGPWTLDLGLFPSKACRLPPRFFTISAFPLSAFPQYVKDHRAWHKSIRPVLWAFWPGPAIPDSLAPGYNHVNK
jgi:hypothetical protein